MRTTQKTGFASKACATLLALCLAASLIPVSAIASDDAADELQESEESEQLESDVVDASELAGDSVTLIEADELSSEEFAQVAATEAANSVQDAEDDVSDTSSSADGTKIVSITATWVTADDEEDGDDSRLTLVKTDNGEFSVKIQVSFELAGEYDYDVGDITITIPKSIFTDRYGTSVGTVTLSVPEAPDSTATFSYTETEDAYVLTNVKALTAASNIMFEISIDELIPNELVGNGELEDGEYSESDVLKYITDAFYAVIEVTTHEGTVISMTSNSIDASLDTSESIGNADIKSNGLSTVVPSGWDASLTEQLDDEDDYIYIEWYSWVSVTGDQNYSMDVTSDASNCGVEGAIILGMYSSYTGLVLNDASADGYDADTMTLSLTDDDYLASGKTGYYVYTYVAIPKSSLPALADDEDAYEIRHDVTYTLTSLDDGTVTTAVDYAVVKYDPKENEGGPGIVSVVKTGGYSYTSALDTLRNGESVTLRYNVTSTGTGGIEVDESTGESTSKAFVMQTDDSRLFLDYSSDMLQSGDFEFASLTITKPSVYEWVQFSESGYGYYYTDTDGDDVADTLTYGLVNGGSWGFVEVTDSSRVPDVDVYGSSDGGQTWTLYATYSWQTGSAVCTYVNTDGGASVSGLTVTFPEGVESVRTETGNTVDGEVVADLVVCKTSPLVRLLASESVQAVAEELFANSDAPQTTLENWVDLDAYYVADDGSLEWYGGAEDDASDTLAGSSLAVTMEKTMTYENDTANQCVDLHYVATVYEHSNLTTLEEYEAAIEAGAFEEETSGVFYDLLPEGVVPDVSSVKMNDDADVVTAVELIEDYEGSGRTMMVVYVSLTPSVTYKSKSVTGAPYNGYCDSFTLTFDATYSWASLTDYGTDVNNVIAFESANATLGTIEGFSGVTASEDDETGIYSTANNAAASAVSGVESYMTGLDASDEDALFVYANSAVAIDVVTSAVTNISKTVSANGSGTYTSGLEKDGDFVNVYENGTYTYRIQVMNDATTQSKGIVIYDNLEAYVPEEKDAESDDANDVRWRGVLTSIDTSLLEELGIDVKIYYSTVEGLVLDSETDVDDRDIADGVDADGTKIWTLLSDDADVDYASITAIAIDCAKLTTDEDGDGEADDFILGTNESISFTMTFQAPNADELAEAYNEENGYEEDDEGYATEDDFFDVDLDDDDPDDTEAGLNGGAHAYNNVVLISQAYDDETLTWGDNQFTYYNYTKVGLQPFSLDITKTFADEDDQDGIRPAESYVVLFADGQAVTATGDDVVEITVGSGDEAVTYTAVKLSDANNWYHLYTDVSVLDEDGAYINYSFAEYVYDEDSGTYVSAADAGYTLGVTQSVTDDGYSYALSNVHVPETIDISGTKTWADDDDDAAGTRPSSVQVALYADGELVSTKTVTADDSGTWSYTFRDLPKYALETVTDEQTGEETTSGGHEIVYEVRESVYYAGYVSTVDGSDITNTYYPYGNISITKSVEDVTDASGDATFTFELSVYDEDGNPDAGSYRYVVYDESGDVALDADGNELTGSIQTGGTVQIVAGQTVVIYDVPSEYTYTVEEVDVPAGFTLSASSGSEGTIYAGQTAEASFTNTYDATGRVYLVATKTLQGRTLAAKQFRFEVQDESGATIRTATNAADGSVTFGSIAYTLEDDGITFTYYILESAAYEDGANTTDADALGYCYDASVYKAVVEVSDNGDGTLATDVTYYVYDADADAWVAVTTTDGDVVSATPTFANSYNAEGSLALVAWKTLSGRDLADGEFTFELVDDATGEVVATGTNDADGIITFSELSFDEADAGQTYTYTAREVAGTDSTVVYTDETFTYTVTVTDNGDGTLSFEYATSEQPVFANELEEGSLQISKSISDASEDDGTDDTFTFLLTLTGTDGMTLGTLEADYQDEDGVYHYRYVEAADDDAGSSEDASSGEDADADDEDGATSSEDDADAASVTTLAAAIEALVEQVQAAASASASSSADDASVDGAVADDSSTIAADDDTDEADATSGTTGSVDWSIDDDGVLTLSPTSGTSGTLDVYSDSNMPPWYSVAESITAVECTGTICPSSSLKNLFYGCTNLTDIAALASWDVSAVTDMGSIFRDCSSLASLDAVSAWDTSSVTNVQNAFRGCTALTSLEALAGWDVSGCTSLYYAFYNCTSLTSLAGLEEWDVSSVTSLNYTFATGATSTSGTSLADISALADWDTSSVANMAGTFRNCRTLASLSGLEGWDTGSVTSLDGTFYGCCSVTTLEPLASWDTSSNTTLASTFAGCTALTSIEALETWDTAAVTTLYYTFSACSALADASAVSGWASSNVTTMERTFNGCSSLVALDLSGWNTACVTTMAYMFASCSALASVELGEGWSTGSVTRMDNTFYGCSSLASLDVSGFSSAGLTWCHNMFANCSSLASLAFGEDWTMASVTNMTYMFNNCTSLQTLSLAYAGAGTTSGAASRASMFSGCSSLQEATFGSSWDWMYDSDDDGVKDAYCTSTSTGGLPDAYEGTLTADDGTTTTYTGCWIREDGSYGSYAVADLATAWDESYAGTWVWEEAGKYYTVNFDANTGGAAYSGAMASRMYSVDDGVTLPESTLYRFGYEFAGWATSADGDAVYADGETLEYALVSVEQLNDEDDPVTSVTLYAVWVKADTTVSPGQDGSYELTLAGGESLIIEGLPAGVGYLVYEQTAAGWVLVDSSGQSGTVQPTETAQATFENTYDIDETQATIVAAKTLDGAGASEGAFSFTLTGISATDADGDALVDDEGSALAVPMPDAADGAASCTVTNADGGGISFGTITYTQAGIYTYTLAEVDDGADGIAYDSTVYTVTVTVTETDDGLVSDVAYSYEQAVEDDDGTTSTQTVSTSLPTFENETLPGSITLSKALEGAELSDQEFTFTVSYNGGLTVDTNVVLNADNDWTWTSGELEAGTTYTITETNIPKGYTFTSFADADGTVLGGQTASGVVAADTTDTYTVTNTYAASGSFAVAATKVLTGDTLTGGQFTFTLVDESGTTVATASNAADGSITFEPITLDAAGTYYYTLSELVPDADDGGYDEDMSYDTSSVRVVVEATDGGNGVLACDVTYWYYDQSAQAWVQYTTTGSDGTTTAASATFTNELKPGALQLSKAVEDGTSTTSAQSFTFTITLLDASGSELEGAYSYSIVDEDGDAAGTGSVASGGTIALKDGQTATIEGLPAGATYTLVEESYDGYTTASEGERGTIAANETSEATFTNTYAASGSWTPSVTKVLAGGVDVAAGDYAFELLDASGQTVLLTGYTDAAATSLDSALGTATASVTFDGSITYTQADAGTTYTYTLIEIEGKDDDITYDTTVYTVSVTVQDNGDGTLLITPVYADEDGTTYSSASFTNVYDHAVVLPTTGSFGMAAGLACGFIILLLAGMALYRRRRTQAA